MKQPHWQIASHIFSGGTAEATALIGRPVRTRTSAIFGTHIGDGKEGSTVKIAGGSTGYLTGAFGMSVVVTLIDPPLQPLPPYDRNKLLALKGRKVTSIVIDWSTFGVGFDFG